MTAPTQSVGTAPATEETTAGGERESTDTRPSSGVRTAGRARMSDAQAVIDCVFDIAATMISTQREITQRSLAAAQVATTAVANAVGNTLRATGPAHDANGLPTHCDGRAGG